MPEMPDRFLNALSCKHSEGIFCWCSGIALHQRNIDGFAHELAGLNLPFEKYDEDYFPSNNVAFAEFVLVSNVINFSTFDPVTKSKIRITLRDDTGGTYSYCGSEALALALRRAEYRGLIKINPDFLASPKFSFDVFCEIFRDIYPRPPYMGMDGEQRFHMIKGFARSTQLYYDSSFWNIVKKSENSACHNNYGLVHRLKLMSGYNGDHLGKRALLSAYMIHSRGMATSDPLLMMHDAALLAPLADPHIFRVLVSRGALILRHSVEEKLNARYIFNSDVQDDAETIFLMRSQSVKAMILLLDRVNKIRKVLNRQAVTMPQIDNFLWRLSRSLGDDRGYFYALTTDC